MRWEIFGSVGSTNHFHVRWEIFRSVGSTNHFHLRWEIFGSVGSTNHFQVQPLTSSSSQRLAKVSSASLSWTSELGEDEDEHVLRNDEVEMIEAYWIKLDNAILVHIQFIPYRYRCPHPFMPYMEELISPPFVGEI